MKKIISIFISLSMILGMSLTTFAKDDENKAVYLSEGAYFHNSMEIHGDIYSSNGNIKFDGSGKSNLINGNIFIADEYDVVYENKYSLPNINGKVVKNQLYFDYKIDSFKNIPKLEEKEPINETWKNVTIKDSGKYKTIKNNSGTITADTSQGDLHFEVENFDMGGNGKFNIIGENKVYLYLNGPLHLSSSSLVNSNGNPGNLNIFLQNHSDIKLEGSSKIFANICNESSKVNISGSGILYGNIFSNAESFSIYGGGKIYGTVYTPNAIATVSQSGTIYGGLIAKTLDMYGNGKIFFSSDYYTDEIPSELTTSSTEEIEDDDDDEDEDEDEDEEDDKTNGLLGTYYDVEEMTNNSAIRLKRIDTRPFFSWQFEAPTGAKKVIEPETFAVRWTGYIKVDKTDDYTFKTLSDDGVRLTINNEMLINRWGLINMEYTSSKKIRLEKDVYYPITFDYQQIPLHSLVYLFWETEESGMSSVPSNVFYVDEDIYEEFEDEKYFNRPIWKGKGLKCDFYEEGSLEVKSSIISPINFDWQMNAPQNVTTDAFSGVFTGYIEAKYTEEVTLLFEVDDHIKVWIDDELVLNGIYEKDGFYLEAKFNAIANNKHKIRIEYKDFQTNATCNMKWRSGLIPMETINPKYLYDK